MLVFIPYIALIVRVWMDINMVIHGYPKIRAFKQTAQQTNQALGIPIKVTYMASILEFFGGIFLIIGLIVPVVAIFFAIFMISIVFMKRKKMNAAYISPQGTSYEVDITYLIISIALFALGAGAFSIDSLINF
ncbi:MAG TPA: DoxX family protein [Bacillus sp. (in: firmicutes)]|nr:DoxX family protein [Bacillus sp. (in: firmicutes)]